MGSFFVDSIGLANVLLGQEEKDDGDFFDDDISSISVVMIVFGLMIVLVYLAMFVILARDFRNDYLKRDVRPHAFHTLLFYGFAMAFFADRTLWIFLRSFLKFDIISHYNSVRVIVFFLERAGILIYCTTFSIVLNYWSIHFQQNFLYATQLNSKIKIILVLLNFIVYFVIITSSFIFVIIFLTQETQLKTVFIIVCITEASCCVLCALLFLAYGAYIFLVEMRARTYEKESKKDLIRMSICTVIFTTCFIIRGVFCYFRGFSTFSKEFLPFTTLIPEIIPLIVQYWVVKKTKSDVREIENIRHQLYEDDEEFLFDKSETAEFLGTDPLVNIKTPSEITQEISFESPTPVLPLSRPQSVTSHPINTVPQSYAPAKKISFSISPLARKNEIPSSFPESSLLDED